MEQRILRPLDYGGLFDEMFDLYKRNFWLFVGIVGVAVIPIQLLGQLVQTGTRDITTAGAARMPDPSFWAGLGLLLLLMPPLYAGMMAAITWAVSQEYLGKKATIAGSYQAVARMILPLLGTMIMVGALLYLGLLACVVPGVLFAFWIAFVSEVLVLERKNGWAAVQRSRQLAAGNWGRIFVLYILSAVLAFIIQLIVSIPTFAISMPAAVRGITPSVGAQVLEGVLSAIGSMISTPIMIIAFVLLYYDLRVRKEGFDIEMLAQDMGESLPGGAVSTAPSPAADEIPGAGMEIPPNTTELPPPPANSGDL